MQHRELIAKSGNLYDVMYDIIGNVDRMYLLSSFLILCNFKPHIPGNNQLVLLKAATACLTFLVLPLDSIVTLLNDI
jgi:hypothetical protein